MGHTLAHPDRPAHTNWLPPGMRPPGGMTHRQAVVFWLVGAAALFGGYDLNVFSFASPQIQSTFHIAEDNIGLTVSIFRLAAIAALVFALSADIIGRRRLLLFTIVGQACFTLATGFAQDYSQFVWLQVLSRVFGYAEEMLCYVVIAEEISAGARGWSNSMMATMYYAGGGIAGGVFAAITYLPYGWRAIYVIGSVPLFLVAYLRRYLPETERFEKREHEVEKLSSKLAGGLDMVKRLFGEHPRRVAIMLLAISAYGFAIWPSAIFGQFYLQKVLHLTPPQTSGVVLTGGAIAAILNIFAGRLSDRIGRRVVICAACFIAMAAFGVLYSGVHWNYVAWMWAVGFFGFVCADSLFAGLAAEIFPTAYRATISGLRYLFSILFGALSLYLEGPLYNWLGGHGPALMALLATMPIAMIAVMQLPEPAGRELEEIANERG